MKETLQRSAARVVLLMMTGGAALQQSTTPHAVTATAGKDCCSVRRYDHEKDHAQLCHICRDVYDGTDYLPAMAQHFAQRADCAMLAIDAIDVDSGQPTLACLGNLRQLDARTHFIEAIRTLSAARGRGLAARMVDELAAEAAQRGAARVLSGTIPQNGTMRRIFGRAGLVQIAAARTADFEVLRQLHVRDPQQRQTMAEGLGVAGLAGAAARRIGETAFRQVTDIETFRAALDALGGCRSASAGITYITALYNAMTVEQAAADVRAGSAYVAYDNMRSNGATDSERGSSSGSSSTGNSSGSGGSDGTPAALVFFFEDPAVTSLSCKTVCTIVAPLPVMFEAAFWFASNARRRWLFVLDPSTPDDTALCPLIGQLPFTDYGPAVLYEKVLVEPTENSS